MAKYTMIGNTKISSSAAVIYRTLTIPATSNQTYTLTLTKGSLGSLPSYTSTATSSAQTLSVPYGTSYSVAHTGSTGYNAGATNSGTVTNSAVSVSHNGASLKYFTLSVGATTNQTYSVSFTTNSSYGGTAPSNVSGQSAAKDFSCPYGCTAVVSYSANSATSIYSYSASSSETKTMTSAQSVAAKSASASVRYFTVTFPATSHQQYSVAFSKESNYVDGTVPSNLGNSYSQRSVNMPIGVRWTISYAADTGYTAGASKTDYKTATSNYTESHNGASLIYYTLSVGASTNQSYKVTGTANSSYGGTVPSSDWITAAGSWSCPYGSTMYVSYSAGGTAPATSDAAYNYSNVYTASSTVTKTMTSAQSVGAASAGTAVSSKSLRYYTLSVGASTNQSYKVTGSAHSSYGGTVPSADWRTSAGSWSCPYGSTMYVTYSAGGTYTTSDTAYVYHYVYDATGQQTLSMTTSRSVGANSASARHYQSDLRYYTLSVGASTNQTYTVSGTAHSSYGGTVPSASARSAAGSWSCPYGSTMYVTYTANSGTWTANCDAQYTRYYCYTASAKQTLSMTQDRSVGAASAGTSNYNTVTNTYTVTMGNHPNCSVVISGYGSAVTNTNKTGVPYGTTITATATADTGYQVDSVTFS